MTTWEVRWYWVIWSFEIGGEFEFGWGWRNGRWECDIKKNGLIVLDSIVVEEGKVNVGLVGGKFSLTINGKVVVESLDVSEFGSPQKLNFNNFDRQGEFKIDYLGTSSTSVGMPGSVNTLGMHKKRSLIACVHIVSHKAIYF